MARKKRCLGVDFGSHSIKVAELVLERDGVRINKLVSAPLVIEAGATPAERQVAIAKNLRELLRSGKISTKEAVFALPGQVAFVRRFRLPATSQERLERIIRYEARQQIPFPLDRTQLEYQFFPVPGENEVEVLLVAVRTDHIQDFVSLVGRTGLVSTCIAISPFALYNFHASQTVSFEELVGGGKPKKGKTGAKGAKSFLNFSFGKKSKKVQSPEVPETGGENGEGEPEVPVYEEVKAYVHIGASAMDLAIARLGKAVFLGFTRSIPTAGNEITRSIQEKCRLDSFADAEKVKIHSTRIMTFDFDPEMAGDEFNVTACQAATSVVDRLVADIRRSLDFYISQPDGMAVDSIVLTGGQSAMPGFAEYIEEKLGLSVSRMDGLQAGWLKMGDKVSAGGEGAAEPSRFATAIGLAFQGIGIERIAVDFLPREKKVLRDFPYKRAAVMLAILAGTIGIASQAGSNYTLIYKRQHESIDTELTSRKQMDGLATKAQADRENVAKMFDDTAPALEERDTWLDFLATIQNVKPPPVLIDTLVMEENGTVMIIGIGENRNMAAEFTKGLKGAIKESEKEPQLTSLDEVDYAGFDRRVWKFTIEFQLKRKINRILPQGAAPPTSGAGGPAAAPQAPVMPVNSGEYLNI